MTVAPKNLLVEDRDGVRLITFNRPKALNALNIPTLEELEAVLEETAQRWDLHAVILTGSGSKAFIAGADIREMANATPEEAQRFAELGHRVISRLERIPQPVIAAVNGFALGGGSEMALACDFIYASENAVFGLPEVGLGLIPGFGGTQRLSRKIPVGMARELILTGTKVKADKALRIGIANAIYPAEELLEATFKTARIIGKQSILAVASAKRAMVQGHDLPLDEGRALEIHEFAQLFATDHAKEGTNAFLEKRPPQFSVPGSNEMK